MEPVIRTEKLTKVYPNGVRAVENLDLEVNRGEIFGFLGPNGAGKTTTVGHAHDAVIPTGGRAFVDGVDVVGTTRPRQAGDRRRSADQHARPLARRLGEPLLPRTVLLDVARRPRSRRRRARSSSSASPTGRTNARRPLRWHGATARWWRGRSCTGPPTLFLDEPTAGLDPQSRIALWEILGSSTATARRS